MSKTKNKVLYIGAVLLFGIVVIALLLWSALHKESYTANAEELNSQYVGSPISFQSWTGMDVNTTAIGYTPDGKPNEWTSAPSVVQFFPTYSIAVSLTSTPPDGATIDKGDGLIPVYFQIKSFTISRWQVYVKNTYVQSPKNPDTSSFTDFSSSLYDSTTEFYSRSKSTYFQVNNYNSIPRVLYCGFPRASVSSVYVKPYAYIYVDCGNPLDTPLEQIDFTFPTTVSFGTGQRNFGNLLCDSFVIQYNYGNSFNVSFSVILPYYSSASTAYRLSVPWRTYYLVNPDGDEFNAGFANGYMNGYDVGYSDGYSTAQEKEYTNGYNVGKTEGYNTGYNAGAAAGNDYTFVRLLTAVVDAPIQAFSGLMDFTILGINMKSFYLSLLTACVMITMIKILF